MCNSQSSPGRTCSRNLEIPTFFIPTLSVFQSHRDPPFLDYLRLLLVCQCSLGFFLFPAQSLSCLRPHRLFCSFPQLLLSVHWAPILRSVTQSVPSTVGPELLRKLILPEIHDVSAAAELSSPTIIFVFVPGHCSFLFVYIPVVTLNYAALDPYHLVSFVCPQLSLIPSLQPLTRPPSWPPYPPNPALTYFHCDCPSLIFVSPIFDIFPLLVAVVCWEFDSLGERKKLKRLMCNICWFLWGTSFHYEWTQATSMMPLMPGKMHPVRANRRWQGMPWAQSFHTQF